VPTTASLRDAYDRVAVAYGRQFADELAAKPLDRALLAGFAELTRGRGTVLEVGCGPGQVGRYLHDLGVDVLGTDLSPQMIDVARSLHPGMRFRVEDLLAVGSPDAAFAGLVAAYAIVHLAPEEVALAAREWARIVVSGGWLLVAFHVEEETATVHLEEFLGERVALDFRFHRVAAVEAALAAAGFDVDARLERRGHAEVEHPSLRAYLLARRC
jgi:SAM-dependent methyltransferase